MEKIIFKKIRAMFISLWTVLFFIFSIYVFNTTSNYAISTLDEMLTQTESLYNKNKENSGQMTEFIKSDSLSENYIAKIVEYSLTIYERAIFIVNKDTGIVEGITQNNELDVNFKNVNSEEEFLKKLEKYKKAGLVKINNKYRCLKTKDLDNYIIGAYVDADIVYKNLIKEIIYLFIYMLIILISITLMCRYAIKKYILKDIVAIETGIKTLMTGNYNFEFETEYDTELRYISNILNHWRESYVDKSQRMSKIINSINSNVGIFECLYSINKSFFSDNMKSILGLSDNEWCKINEFPIDFEYYIDSLIKSNKNENGLIFCNDKFLNIVFFKGRDQFYGIIIDKTEDEKTKIEIEKKLINKEKEAQTDSLTKLLNRSGLENSIKKIIENQNNLGKAILIMFDLDNFKTINDKLGHPIGDEVLKYFAECLRLFFYENAIVSRIAGDEFMVFIDEDIDREVLEDKLRSLIDEIHIKLKYYYIKYKLSTSIGVIYVDKEIDTYEEMYKRVDNALYTAKRLGKDRFYIK